MIIPSGYNLNVTRFILQDEEPTDNQNTRIRSMQVCRAGTFFDERYGEFTISKAMLSEMIDNFQSNARGVIPALDYKHESDDVAAGWFKKLYLKDDELWADIEMTPKGLKVLSDKEFGYVSADFETGYQDNETKKKYGCVLMGAGLTNRPVIKRMESVITLSEKTPSKSVTTKTELSEGDKIMEEKMKELEAKCAEYEKQLSEMTAKMANMIDKPIEAPKPDPIEEAKPEVEVELAAVKAELAEAKKTITLAEKTSEFVALLSEGKAVEAQRESYIAGDMKSFIEKSVAIKLTEAGVQKTPTEEDAITADQAEDKILSEAIKLSEEKKISMKEAISEVLKNNKKLADKIR